ncbi:MAG: ATP-binding protein [Syntrophobacteraceae bacterium]|nr:ATP-binding protein [Syntrophobacteraceae bacterium]
MKRGLLFKLLTINIPVAALAIVVLWVVLDTLAAGYFSALMREYRINPLDVHRMFIHSVHRYLIWTSAGALVLGALLSSLLTRMVLRPLYQMIKTAGLIAGGDYSSRVRADSHDEIGELASAFNLMAESLERVEQLRKDMVSNVAHELRTPLTNIRGYMEALQDGVVAPTEQTFRLLHEESLRLISLVEDLLELARADAARFSLDIEQTSLEELTSRALKKFDLEFRQKNIEIREDFSKPGTPAPADREKLARVVENLLQNGLRYTPENGWILVGTKDEGGSVKFFIQNSGPGIEAKDLPFIFERFYRAEKSRSRAFGGTGIGLAIVKEIIEAHGGRAGVESSPEKTLFWFSLPLRGNPEAASRHAASFPLSNTPL